MHRVFDDLKGHKEQRFPLHLDEKDLEEDQCHVVVSRRGRSGANISKELKMERVHINKGLEMERVHIDKGL